MGPKKETRVWMQISDSIKRLAEDMNLPVAWPAEVFEVPEVGGVLKPYLRVARVYGTPQRQLISGGKPNSRTGSFVVCLVYPIGQNVLVYDQLAATIAEYFQDGTCITGHGVDIHVTSYPRVHEGYESDGYWNVPVTIPWRTFL